MSKLSIKEINLKTCEIVKNIKILDKISWPSHIEANFFEQLQIGNRPSLKFDYPKVDLSEQKSALIKLTENLGNEETTHIYTLDTINSYINAIEMIECAGSKNFEELSIKEYGRPNHKLFGSNYSHLETAKQILKNYHQFDHPYIKEDQVEYDAKAIKKYLTKESKKALGDDCPKFKLSQKLVSKAAAGRTSVRLRKNGLFSSYDFEQLYIHEVMTHSLTAINGSMQAELPLLAQGAPRTTKTQEGLATFSEVITGCMDLERLKRISLRVIAIDHALNGANFYDLYDFFINNQQEPKEAYLSTTRILRGGTAEGGIVFTKDGVYLEGLIRVHSFFRWAFKTQNLDMAHLLFCGRLDINDIFLLRNDYVSGLIQPPKHLPTWYKNIDLLAGKLAFSLLLNGIDLDAVEKHYTRKIFVFAA